MSLTNNIFYSLCLLMLMSNCQQKNKLAQNEDDIIREVAELEETPVEVKTIDRSGTSLDIPEQSRIANKENPPVVLDILAARSDLREIRFTDLYSNINYVPIRFVEPVDPLWNEHEDFDFLITPNNIIASQYSYGISQFDLNGKFINQIVKSETHYTLSPNTKSPQVNSKRFRGVKGKVHALGDQVYYQHHDAAEKEGMWMEFNAAPGELSGAAINAVEESYSQAKGKMLSRFESKMYREYIAQQGANNIFPISETEWISSSAKYISSKSGVFLASVNLQGDTITKFKDHDPVRNFANGLWRDVDARGSQYTFLGVQHVRPGYNDTIYTLNNAHTLRPKYIIDFGSKGIKSTLEGIDSHIDLKDKYVLYDLIETNKYLFIRYTRDYPSPFTVRKGTVFYNACIYDKSNKELFHIYIDQPPYLPDGKTWPKPPPGVLENDYDRGLVFWPMKTTADGRPFQWIKGLDLKSHIKAGLWESETITFENMKDDDYLIMIAQ